jgi:hypothetical protein
MSLLKIFQPMEEAGLNDGGLTPLPWLLHRSEEQQESILLNSLIAKSKPMTEHYSFCDINIAMNNFKTIKIGNTTILFSHRNYKEVCFC